MALSRLAFQRDCDRRDELCLLLVQQQALLSAKRCELHALRLQKSAIRKKRQAAEKRCRFLMACALRMCMKEPRLWAHHRPPSWYDTTVPTLSDQDFKANFRVTRQTFAYVVSSCRRLQRVDTNMRKAIPLEKRVALSLYRLATSGEERTVANLFGVSRPSVNIIFREFCDIVVEELQHVVMKMPTRGNIKDHVRQFAAVTGFPQGFGALDGCHIKVSPPKKIAQDYYNYKGWYSIILLALVDHNYKFMYTIVGSPGKNHDSNVYKYTVLPRLAATGFFSAAAKVIGGESIGSVILCDQAFPLQAHLMKPYPHRHTCDEAVSVFNYTLSKARRVVENAFGRLKARFRILKGLECSIGNANRIVKTCCTIHNICEEMRDECDTHWSEEVGSELPQPVCISHRTSVSAERVRSALARHLLTTNVTI